MEAAVAPAGFAPDFAAFEETRPAGGPAWLVRLQRQGRERFEALGFPTPRLEEWKYTSISPITRTPWMPATGRPVELPSEGSLSRRRIPGAVELVFVNGRFSSELSRLSPLPEGIRLGSLSEALTRLTPEVASRLGRLSSEEGAFSALNEAFLEDGAYIEIAEGAIVETPLHLIFASAREERPALSSPRVLIVAGPHSQSSVVETYLGSGGEAFTNAVTEIDVADGASLQHVKVQDEHEAASHVHAILARVGRSARIGQHNLSFGAALARTDIKVTLAGEGAECALNGLSVASGTQHIDNHTLIDHAVPHGTSRELYKGIWDGRSRGVFHGKIVVRAGAQKTDALQTNRNLLLSRQALVNSTPALEILADDVKCRHGSTIGQIEEAPLFYLRSRGLDEDAARRLLTYAFAADVSARLPIEPIRASVESFLVGALGPAGEMR
jgi:Fe-S cluster assembly protein SufD